MNAAMNSASSCALFSIAYAAMNTNDQAVRIWMLFSIAYAAMNGSTTQNVIYILFSIAYAAMNALSSSLSL